MKLVDFLSIPILPVLSGLSRVLYLLKTVEQIRSKKTNTTLKISVVKSNADSLTTEDK